MKKLFITTLVIASIVLTPSLKAGDPFTEEVDREPQMENVQGEDPSPSEGTPVSQTAGNNGRKSAKKKQWQNIALAVGAIAVAVTAMLLVAHHDGRKK